MPVRKEPGQVGSPSAVPIPDPTSLTTQQLLRELLSLRELLESGMGATSDKIEHVRDDLALIPSIITERVAQLEKLHDERFNSIQTQFRELDKRIDQNATATKIAVDAALKAQQEASSGDNKNIVATITKSDIQTSKQIDQLGALITADAASKNDKISELKDNLVKSIGDLKDRVNAGENRASTSEGRTKGGENIWGIVIGAGGLLVAIIAVVATVILSMRH